MTSTVTVATFFSIYQHYKCKCLNYSLYLILMHFKVCGSTSAVGKRSLVARAQGDAVACSRCCTGEYCNEKLCGLPRGKLWGSSFFACWVFFMFFVAC